MAWNEAGPVRSGASTNWVAQAASPWPGAFPSSLNHKHADTNGDGVVNAADSSAIYQNYGLTHPLRLNNNTATSAGEFFLVPNANAVAPGQTVTYEIHLSDASAPVSNLYGIAFTLSLDPTLVDTNQIVFDYSTSVLGNMGVNMIAFEKNFYSLGATDAALTRTDQVDVSNVHGILGTLTVTTSPNVTTASPLVITPGDITLLNMSGTPVTLTPVQDSIIIDPALSGSAEYIMKTVSIYPNPVHSELTINSKDIISVLELTDIKGNLVYHNLPGTSSIKVPTSTFENGIYILKVLTSDAVVNLKVMISH